MAKKSITLFSIFEFFIAFIFTLGALALGFFVVFMAAMYYFDINAHKNIFEEQFFKQTGQKLALRGPVKIVLLPFPKIDVSDADIQFKWDDTQYQLTIKHLKFSLGWSALYSENVKIKGVDAQNITMFMGKDQKLTTLESFKGDVITSCCHVDFPNFNMKLNGNDLSGKMLLYPLSNIIKIKADLKSKLWDASVQASEGKEPRKAVLPFMGLAASWLNRLDGDILFFAKELNIDELKLTDANININFDKKVAQIKINGKASEGQITSNITLDQSKDRIPLLQGNFEIKQANAAAFFKQFVPQDPLSGGSLNMRFTGKTQGLDFDQWKANLTGQFFIDTRDLILKNQQIDSRLVDIFAAFWKMFSRSKNQTQFQCIVGRFNTRNGVMQAKESIGVETPELYALGTGEIILRNDQINMAFDIYPRSQINLEVGVHDQLVYIKGPLSNPQVTASSKGLITEGGSILLGIATGGMSLLAEKFINIVRQKGSPCKIVLEE